MRDDVLDQIISNPELPFAMIYREVGGSRQVDLLILEKRTAGTIGEGMNYAGGSHHGSLLVLPYRQVKERGFEAIDDGMEIYALPIRERATKDLSFVLERIPDIDLSFSEPGFNIDDQGFAEIVRRLIDTEIAGGTGSNFVLHRKLCCTVEGYTSAHLLTMFRRLLTAETNAHWVYVIHTGDYDFAGASPELHAGLRGDVLTMNPISGTLSRGAAETRDGLRAFLSDEKEISELFMVVDEELKSMARLCPEGVRVSGPNLQWLQRVVHTEYKLDGRTPAGIPEILRESIPMPTVTGSPVRSACEVISKYEPDGRGYYSGVIALVEDQRSGAELDSVIGIRSAEISADGRVRIGAGATIVRDSDPELEAAETTAKANSIYSALSTPSQPSIMDSDVEQVLKSRNGRLSQYWLADPTERAQEVQHLQGIHALVVDAQDSFTWMLCSLLRSAGAHVEVCSVDELHSEDRLSDSFDLVIAGPGPGDPRDSQDPRIERLRSLITHLLATRKPLLAVCLSHQVLCSILGVPLRRLSTPNQGTQRPVAVAGMSTLGGFYNSYAGIADTRTRNRLQDKGITPVTTMASNELDGLIGPTFASVQFHLESILTINGQDVLQAILQPVLDRTPDQAPKVVPA